MQKYISGRGVKSDFDEWGYYDDRSSIEVFESDNRPVDTGLLDVHGDRIFRVIERQPIGFRVRL